MGERAYNMFETLIKNIVELGIEAGMQNPRALKPYFLFLKSLYKLIKTNIYLSKKEEFNEAFKTVWKELQQYENKVMHADDPEDIPFPNEIYEHLDEIDEQLTDVMQLMGLWINMSKDVSAKSKFNQKMAGK